MINKLLAQLGMTNKEFAVLIGVSAQTMSNRKQNGVDAHTIATLRLMVHTQTVAGPQDWSAVLTPTPPAMPPAMP